MRANCCSIRKQQQSSISLQVLCRKCATSVEPIQSHQEEFVKNSSFLNLSESVVANCNFSHENYQKPEWRTISHCYGWTTLDKKQTALMQHQVEPITAVEFLKTLDPSVLAPLTSFMSFTTGTHNSNDDLCKQVTRASVSLPSDHVTVTEPWHVETVWLAIVTSVSRCIVYGVEWSLEVLLQMHQN